MALLWLIHRVFTGTGMRLDVGFNAAQARLANLARGGLRRRASDDAYGEWGTGLARISTLGAAPGVSRLVAVRFRLALSAGFGPITPFPACSSSCALEWLIWAPCVTLVPDSP
jgi:hypothetical protein